MDYLESYFSPVNKFHIPTAPITPLILLCFIKKGIAGVIAGWVLFSPCFQKENYWSISFIPPSRRSWHLVSLFPAPLLAQVSYLSLLHKRPMLPAALFGHSLRTAIKSTTTELRFGCQHSKDKMQVSSYSRRGLEMSQISQLLVQRH